MAGPSKDKIKAATEELEANVEASQGQAVLDNTDLPQVAKPPSLMATSEPASDLHTLGGYPVPRGAEHDVFVEDERVFYDRPGGEGCKEVKLKDGVAPVDVWEAVYQNNAKLPTFVLVAGKGQVVDGGAGRHPGTTRMSDF